MSLLSSKSERVGEQGCSIKHGMTHISYAGSQSVNGESGRTSHLVYKFDKQIAKCNNSQIKVLNLFEFPHILN